MEPKNPRSPCVDLKMLKLEIIEKIDTPARVCAQRSINIVICQTLFKTFTFGTFKDLLFRLFNFQYLFYFSDFKDINIVFVKHFLRLFTFETLRLFYFKDLKCKYVY